VRSLAIAEDLASAPSADPMSELGEGKAGPEAQ